MSARTPDCALVPRSCLVVPVSDERKTAKALASEADEVVLDLEDAVEPGSKTTARERVAQILAEAARPGLAVRVNQVGTAWCHLDVLAAAAAATGPLTVVVPKVEDAADVSFVDRLIAGAVAGRDGCPEIRLDVLIESAAGLENVDRIVTAAARIRAVVIGYADLGANLGCDLEAAAPGARSLRAQVRSRVLLAARAAGRAVVDGPWLSIAADAEFAADRRQARDQGFDGSWTIHPAQLGVVNDLFTPAPAEVDWAHGVLDALAGAAARGSGAVALDGQMLDAAVAVRASRVLARAGERR